MVVIEVIDQTSGRPVRSWTFADSYEISIGRSPDCDVEVSDPYVSRTHAQLVFSGNRWVLLSLGKNGVLIRNQMVKEHQMAPAETIRLGVEGPTLRFRQSSSAEAEQPSANETISFSDDAISAFSLDRQRVQQEVQQVMEGQYFQRLQQMAKELRRGAV